MEENFKTWEYNPLPRKKKFHKQSDFCRRFPTKKEEQNIIKELISSYKDVLESLEENTNDCNEFVNDICFIVITKANIDTYITIGYYSTNYKFYTENYQIINNGKLVMI